MPDCAMTGSLPPVILVVDDDPGLVRLMERALRREGYQTFAAGSGKEATEWLQQHRAELLLLDLKLPDVEGPELLQSMIDAGHAVPFVIITGQGDERVAVDMMKRGALDYLVKDVNFIEFVPTVVGRALEQLERSRRLAAAERKERERAVELAAILDAVPMPIFIAHDPDCRHITGNRAADELLRNPRAPGGALMAGEGALGPHIKAIKDGRELSVHELPAQRAARGIPVRNFEFNLIFDDGVTRDMLAYATPLRDDEGKPRGAITVLVDISDRRQAEAAVLRAIEEEQRRIGRDLHDGLGQELTAMAMLNNVVQKGIEAKGLPEAATVARLAGLLKEAAREVRIISHGLQPVAAEPDGLRAGLRNLVAQAVAPSGVKCLFVCPEMVEVHAPASANHFYRIAQEAVQNALRHGNPQHVTVRLMRGGETVTLEVQDDGAGLPDEPGRTGGIGMSTMRYRADAMKGRLEFARPPEGGTLLRCSAPCPQPVREEE